mmetsp:Transcript_108189/g.303052  ORF Transcript_108189/g.303052 Transcript_108189/m.303052 type:complete len:267 (+) Transcript_108189:116-916(+)|eukprot:CAMPEP_0176244056 /NCGR_PEP_ID=MMETSP0121_2-20121125/31238_1 /TAXON_ID=160619 /ORGANISM="Kryptoperidinium foliaceum, Strain CCMP 1326" /LENGTH=266 /DNA_ID=CAMNT_0017583659 /DNA_START=108 /DNA_END=908 /DNA_ORIENTATION=-
MLAVVVVATLVVGGCAEGRAGVALAEDIALSLLEESSSSEGGAGGAPQSPSSAAGMMNWGGDQSGEWRYKWGRIFKKTGGDERVVVVQYTTLDKPDAKVIVSSQATNFDGDACRKSLDVEWPVWFCLPAQAAHRGKTFVYLLARRIDGWDDEEHRGGLITEAPYTGFVAWSRVEVHAGNYTSDIFDAVRLVTLDLAEQTLVVEYSAGRVESRIFLQQPKSLQGERCMAHAGPMPPVWFCVRQPTATLRVYARGSDGTRGALVAEAS